ncbi:MAG: hypothetical protein QOH36_961 [Actinomycetota bacterium]|nr:hypothetical protein [Actinomycetota bacterium]
MGIRGGRTAAQVVGFAGHLVVGIFYLAVGLVVPGAVIPLFWAFWVLLAVLTVKHRHDPRWVLATPVVAIFALLAAVALGEAVFGWTA